jgi:hypothetical protein
MPRTAEIDPSRSRAGRRRTVRVGHELEDVVGPANRQAPPVGDRTEKKEQGRGGAVRAVFG